MIVIRRILSVEELLEQYRVLTTEKTNDLIQLEQKKLLILERIVEQLKHDSNPILAFPKEDPKVESAIRKNLKRFFYYLLLAFGTIEDVANSFFFGSALFFSLFPAISNASLLIASVIYVGIESALFIIYDSAQLRDALGIHDPHTSLSPVIDLYSKQLKQAIELNQYLAMMSALTMETPLFLTYMEIASYVNRDLKLKHKQMERIEESIFQKILRHSVFVFGAISSLAGSYFMATTILSMCCAGLLATPIGVAIILTTMVIGIVFHYAMDTTSLTRIVNPDHEKCETLKSSLLEFDQMYSEDLSALKQLRFRFQKLPDNSLTDKQKIIPMMPKISELSLFKSKETFEIKEKQSPELVQALPMTMGL